MTADKSKGVLLWTEDPGNTEHYLVYQQDFTVDASGVLTLETPFQLLPLDGEIIPAAVNYYFSMDIWGDATHDSLYMAVFRNYAFGSGPEDGIKELLIYNLNDMTDVRKIYSDTEAAFEWNCPDVSNPQFVPTCYRPENIRFNPSGTRLYMNHNTRDTLGQRWDAGLRIHIDYLNAVTGGVANLTDWIFSVPELVYTGTDETSGALARPENDSSLLPDPELIAVRKFQDVGSILDADQCAYEYSFYVSGAWSLPPDFWHQCIVTGTFFSPNIHGGGDSWQSPDAILTSTYARRGYDIYRRYIAGPLAGTEELLIENARGADTGY